MLIAWRKMLDLLFYAFNKHVFRSMSLFLFSVIVACFKIVFFFTICAYSVLAQQHVNTKYYTVSTYYAEEHKCKIQPKYL